MVKEVVWTIRASKTHLQIIDYLSVEFGDAVVSDVVTTVHHKIELIASNLFLFRKSSSQKNIFITVIHKRVTLAYRYKPIRKRIELLYSGIRGETHLNPHTSRFRQYAFI